MTEPVQQTLRALVREVTRDTLLHTPADRAHEVWKRLGTDEARAEALRQALPVFVRQCDSENRMPTRLDYVGKSAGSGKVAAIREGWQRALHEHKVHLAKGVTKPLGDCTFADLVYAAEQREEQARRNGAKAKQYRGLADTLTEHGVDRVELLKDLWRASRDIHHDLEGATS